MISSRHYNTLKSAFTLLLKSVGLTKCTLDLYLRLIHPIYAHNSVINGSDKLKIFQTQI